MYKICQMVTHHFLWAQSTNALDVLADEDHLPVGADHQAEAIKAVQQAEILGPISCLASR